MSLSISARVNTPSSREVRGSDLVYGKHIIRGLKNYMNVLNTWAIGAGFDAEGTSWFEGKYIRLAMYNKSLDIIISFAKYLKNNLNIDCNISLDKRTGVYRLRISSQSSVLKFAKMVGLRHSKFHKILSHLTPYHHGP